MAQPPHALVLTARATQVGELLQGDQYRLGLATGAPLVLASFRQFAATGAASENPN